MGKSPFDQLIQPIPFNPLNPSSHHICYINDPGVGPLAINLTYSTGPSTKNPAKPPINPLIDSLKTQLSGISLEDSKSQYPLRPLLNSTQANTIFRLQPYPCNGQLTPTKTTNTTQVIRQSVFDHLDVALDNIRVLLTKPFGKGLVYAYGEIFALQKAIQLAPQPVPIEIKWTGTPGTDWYAEGRFDVLGEGEGNPRGDITGEENFDCATG